MASVRAARLAGQQWGVIGHEQLRRCGVARRAAYRWRADGRLHPMLPGVDALGRFNVPTEGWLVAALIHASPGAALSHATAAWWWGLIPEHPAVIDVATLGRARSSGRVRVHHPRALVIVRHRRMPITSVARTLRDQAARATVSELRRQLSEAEYRKLLDVAAVRDELGHGRAGSARLGEALARHEPRLAWTRSDLELAFLQLCERHGIRMPEVNARIDRMTVDALWRAERVVVELDGRDGHRSWAQIQRDRKRELHLRALGFLVLRYTWEQVAGEPERVATDLLAALAARAAG